MLQALYCKASTLSLDHAVNFGLKLFFKTALSPVVQTNSKTWRSINNQAQAAWQREWAHICMYACIYVYIYILYNTHPVSECICASFTHNDAAFSGHAE